MTKITQLPPSGISWNLVFERQTNSDHDLTALLTKVRLDESISILVNKAFTDDWFNKTYVLKKKISLLNYLKLQLPRNSFSLMVCCTNKRMELPSWFPLGSNLSSLSANMCHIEHVPPRREAHTRCLHASSVQKISWWYSCKNADY